MINISPQLLQLYQKGGRFLFNAKLQVLDHNYKVLQEFSKEIFDGQITADNSQLTVRSFDIKLTNIDGALTWGPNNLIWLDKYFKPFFGVWVNGDWEWIPLGVYPCSMPIADSESTGTVKNEVEFQGGDKMDFLGTCTDTVNVKTGADIATSIKSVLTAVNAETLFNLDSTTGQQTVPYDMSWAPGTAYSQVISDLANILVWEIYYDVDGYLRLHAPIDPNTTVPSLSLTSDGGFTLYAGAQRQMDDSDLANYIQVYGGSTQTSLVSYTMEDTDPNSPTAVQKIGRRVYLWNNGNADPQITTAALAQARAEYEYKNRLQVMEKLNFQCFPIPFMDLDDVYEVEDPRNETTGKYQVTSFTLPIGFQSQSYHTGYLWQVRNFAS